MISASVKYDWIDGLKGIACLIVATNHIHNLFPVVKLPLALYNGGIMVYVFVLLSIILSSVSIFRRIDGETPSIDCAKYIISRYICLFIPVLLIILITLCGYYFRAFDSYQSTMAVTGGYDPAVNYAPEIMTIKHALRVSLLAPVVGQNHIVFTIWMLPYIFTGNMVAMLKCNLVKNMKFKYATMFLVIVGCFEWFLRGDSIMLLSSVGVYIGYLLYFYQKYNNNITKNFIVSIVGILCLLIGIIAANGLIESSTNFDSRVFGAILIVVGVFLSKAVQTFFSMKPIVYLGKISMGIYYVHQPITTSFCCFAFMLLLNTRTILFSSVITYVLFFVLIIILGYFFTKITNIFTNKVQVTIIKIFLNS